MKYPMPNVKYQISNILVGLVILLGLVLRLYTVTNVPPGLTWDEAALGYNAYSILKTGRDEYGALLPINLKSFGDYKPALYTYLDIPFVAILGLNELAVRLPSVLAGVIFIGLIFLLVDELFKKKLLSVLSALFAAISPLSLQFSRAAWESNVATVLNMAGVYLFLLAVRKKGWYFIWPAIVWGLSLMTYQGSRLFVPILVVGLLMLYRKSLNFRSQGMFGLLGVLGLFGIIVGVVTFGMGQSDRLSTNSFFAYTRSTDQINQISQEDGLPQDSLEFQFLHGEWFAYVRGLVERYVIYFSPKTLFVEGDYSPRHKIADMGVLLYYSLVLFACGIYFLVIQKNRSAGLIIFYLAVAPLPGVLSRDLISMVRSLNLVVPFTVLEGAGLYLLVDWLWKGRGYWRVVGRLGLFGVLGVILLNYGMYLDSYYVHTPVQFSQGYLYGYKQALLMADIRNSQKWSGYDHIVMTDTYGQPYIYYLFYSQYPPEKYQQQAALEQKTVDVGTVRKIDNIEFRHIFWPGDRGTKNSLFIGTKEELPDQDVKPFPEFNLVGDVNFLDNTNAFRVVETKP